MNYYRIFALSQTQELGLKVAKNLKQDLGNLYTTKFSDGEVFSRFDETIRGKTIFLIAQANMPYEHLFELFITIDAARRASAKEIVCILPYLPHSRQERRDDKRGPISARLIADFIERSGADRLITIDLHSTAIEGFFKIPVDHIETNALFMQHITTNYKNETYCICSPDFGGLKRIKKYKQELNCDMAVIHKERLAANQVSHMEIIGDVKDKHVIIVDDIVDTAGTLCKAADVLMENGALSVVAYATHGILSGNALQNINASLLKKLYITDTVKSNLVSDKIEVLSCSKLISRSIEILVQNRSFTDLNK